VKANIIVDLVLLLLVVAFVVAAVRHDVDN